MKIKNSIQKYKLALKEISSYKKVSLNDVRNILVKHHVPYYSYALNQIKNNFLIKVKGKSAYEYFYVWKGENVSEDRLAGIIYRCKVSNDLNSHRMRNIELDSNQESEILQVVRSVRNNKNISIPIICKKMGMGEEVSNIIQESINLSCSDSNLVKRIVKTLNKKNK
jgi:hypothetical protein